MNVSTCEVVYQLLSCIFLTNFWNRLHFSLNKEYSFASYVAWPVSVDLKNKNVECIEYYVSYRVLCSMIAKVSLSVLMNCEGFLHVS